MAESTLSDGSRFFAEFTLSEANVLRMTVSEGRRMTQREGFRMTCEGLGVTVWTRRLELIEEVR